MTEKPIKSIFHASLKPLDSESQTQGCRHTNPDVCANHSLPQKCAFVREDGICFLPPKSWPKQYRQLKTKWLEEYKSSKARMCVTVGMMTTGYDCKDLLNICLVRPVYSASEFIQMKGRGTRTNDFKFHWISPNEIPDGVESIKEEFYLFDFMGNYEYFEQDYDYDEILELPPAFKANPSVESMSIPPEESARCKSSLPVVLETN